MYNRANYTIKCIGNFNEISLLLSISNSYYAAITAVTNDARESLFNNIVLLVTKNSVMFTIISLEALGKSLITHLTFS